MTPKFWLDLETFSEVPIQNGTHAYAEGVEVLLFAYAVDNGAPQVIDLTERHQHTGDLFAAVRNPRAQVAALLQWAKESGAEVWAHNSHFDRTVLRHTFPEVCPPVEQWRDTMVQALAHSLPGKLDQLCSILKIPADKAKDKRGKQLIQLFCKPLGKNRKLRRATSETHPADWAVFVDYATSDIWAMREVHKRAPVVNYPNNLRELALWHHDQRINDRGTAVDLDLARAAVAAVDTAQVELAEETQRLTRGEVQAATQRQAMLDHLMQDFGYYLADLRGSTVERVLSDPDTPPGVRALLLVRQQASTTSTAKYKALLKAASRDGRLRGLLQFCGALRTGRWAGRTFQPQNLPRPSLSQEEIDRGIDALKDGVAELLFDNLMALASSAIRGCIVAPVGRKLCIADLSNIEGRMLAWLSGEEWKLRAFREFDAGTGADLYALAYAKSFGVTADVVMHNKKHGDGSMRQIGKVQELALGYQGGVGAFVTFALAYSIDLDDMARGVLENAPGDLVAESRDFHEWLSAQKDANTFGLAPDTFVACEVVKRGWRLAHAATVDWWDTLEGAFIGATNNPGVVFDAGSVKLQRKGNWLYLRLPSGRRLCYPSPQVSPPKKGQRKPVCSYMGVDQFTRQWVRVSTYGGKLAENVTQAAARDALAENVPAILAEGYEITLSVHDELLTETPDDPAFSSGRLVDLMSTVPAWAPGLPLAAAGFEADRYKKD